MYCREQKIKWKGVKNLNIKDCNRVLLLTVMATSMVADAIGDTAYETVPETSTFGNCIEWKWDIEPYLISVVYDLDTQKMKAIKIGGKGELFNG